MLQRKLHRDCPTYLLTSEDPSKVHHRLNNTRDMSKGAGARQVVIVDDLQRTAPAEVTTIPKKPTMVNITGITAI